MDTGGRPGAGTESRSGHRAPSGAVAVSSCKTLSQGHLRHPGLPGPPGFCIRPDPSAQQKWEPPWEGVAAEASMGQSAPHQAEGQGTVLAFFVRMGKTQTLGQSGRQTELCRAGAGSVPTSHGHSRQSGDKGQMHSSQGRRLGGTRQAPAQARETHSRLSSLGLPQSPRCPRAQAPPITQTQLHTAVLCWTPPQPGHSGCHRRLGVSADIRILASAPGEQPVLNAQVGRGRHPSWDPGTGGREQSGQRPDGEREGEDAAHRKQQAELRGSLHLPGPEGKAPGLGTSVCPKQKPILASNATVPIHTPVWPRPGGSPHSDKGASTASGDFTVEGGWLGVGVVAKQAGPPLRHQHPMGRWFTSRLLLFPCSCLLVAWESGRR